MFIWTSFDSRTGSQYTTWPVNLKSLFQALKRHHQAILLILKNNEHNREVLQKMTHKILKVFWEITYNFNRILKNTGERVYFLSQHLSKNINSLLGIFERFFVHIRNTINEIIITMVNLLICFKNFVLFQLC